MLPATTGRFCVALGVAVPAAMIMIAGFVVAAVIIIVAGTAKLATAAKPRNEKIFRREISSDLITSLMA